MKAECAARGPLHWSILTNENPSIRVKANQKDKLLSKHDWLRARSASSDSLLRSNENEDHQIFNGRD